MYCVNDSFTCSNVILNEILEFQKKEQIWRSLLYPDSGISMDEEIGLGNMILSYSKAEL